VNTALASRTLNAPNGQTAEPNAGIMRVAGQTAAVTGRFVDELKTQGEDEGEDKLDKCLAIVNELQVGGWILKIDGNRAVLPRRFGGLSHVSSPLKSRRVWMRHREGNVLKWQAYCERVGALPLNPLECEFVACHREEYRT
jgi:hypothetical protein